MAISAREFLNRMRDGVWVNGKFRIRDDIEYVSPNMLQSPPSYLVTWKDGEQVTLSFGRYSRLIDGNFFDSGEDYGSAYPVMSYPAEFPPDESIEVEIKPLVQKRKIIVR